MPAKETLQESQLTRLTNQPSLDLCKGVWKKGQQQYTGLEKQPTSELKKTPTKPKLQIIGMEQQFSVDYI